MTRRDLHKKRNRGRLFRVSLIGLLVVLVGCVALFVSHQSNPVVQNDEATSSTLQSSKKKSSNRLSKYTKSSNSEDKASGTSKSNGRTDNDKPNAGKVLHYTSAAEAESAIRHHEATCPYSSKPFYPGLVYTGTFKCNCGLTINWWDKSLKESVNRDMSSAHEEHPENDDSWYDYDTSDRWNSNTNSWDDSSNTQSSYSDNNEQE